MQDVFVLRGCFRSEKGDAGKKQWGERKKGEDDVPNLFYLAASRRKASQAWPRTGGGPNIYDLDNCRGTRCKENAQPSAYLNEWQGSVKSKGFSSVSKKERGHGEEKKWRKGKKACKKKDEGW